jgi:spore germination cell wall hydrolase CwlJ-like protein
MQVPRHRGTPLKLVPENRGKFGIFRGPGVYTHKTALDDALRSTQRKIVQSIAGTACVIAVSGGILVVPEILADKSVTAAIAKLSQPVHGIEKVFTRSADFGMRPDAEPAKIAARAPVQLASMERAVAPLPAAVREMPSVGAAPSAPRVLPEPQERRFGVFEPVPEMPRVHVAPPAAVAGEPGIESRPEPKPAAKPAAAGTAPSAVAPSAVVPSSVVPAAAAKPASVAARPVEATVAALPAASSPAAAPADEPRVVSLPMPRPRPGAKPVHAVVAAEKPVEPLAAVARIDAPVPEAPAATPEPMPVAVAAAPPVAAEPAADPAKETVSAAFARPVTILTPEMVFGPVSDSPSPTVLAYASPDAVPLREAPLSPPSEALSAMAAHPPVGEEEIPTEVYKGPDALKPALVEPPMPASRPAELAKPVEPLKPKTPAEILGLNAKQRARAERCLAEAVYFEARNEPVRGQIAVAQVVMNRVFSPYYPGEVCAVVYQNAHRHLSCQFTFACDGIPERVSERGPWQRAQRIAKQTLDGKIWRPEVAKATHYHADYVKPKWIRDMRTLVKHGRHIFYRPHAWGDGRNELGWVRQHEMPLPRPRPPALVASTGMMVAAVQSEPASQPVAAPAAAQRPVQ